MNTLEISKAEDLQTEMHHFHSTLLSERKNISYEDSCKIFMLTKISELFNRIEKIEEDLNYLYEKVNG